MIVTFNYQVDAPFSLCYSALVNSASTAHRLFTLAATALLLSCESVRTVYDENGKEVRESEGARVSDMYSRMDEKFNAAFSETRNAQGVPETKSKRVSSFQRDIDDARKADSPFATKAFGGSRSSDLQGRAFEGGSIGFTGSKRFEGSRSSSITTDMRPDFMNEHRGLAHRDYKGSSARSLSEGSYTDDAGRAYGTHASSYRRDQKSGYFEHHRNDTPPPPIRDHRDTQTKEIMNFRNILGRDKTDAAQ